MIGSIAARSAAAPPNQMTVEANADARRGRNADGGDALAV
jgi:hypothetical protein